VIPGWSIRRDQVGAWGVRLLAVGLVLWALFQLSALSFAGYTPTGSLRPGAWPVVGVGVMAVGFAAWAA
jgi:hypothetical protein